MLSIYAMNIYAKLAPKYAFNVCIGRMQSNASTITANEPGHHPAPDEFLTKEEVAVRLKKKLRTVDSWMKRGILPYYKFGRSVAFKWSDVVTYADTNFRRCNRVVR